MYEFEPNIYVGLLFCLCLLVEKHVAEYILHSKSIVMARTRLTKPVYKGHVIMPNPNSSGTGFLDVSSWLQSFGEDKGWQFMDKLHNNISRYTHSGSKPCKLAASGETAIA